jgi:D-alanyl-D-alanine carboxypeptidase (penicillin-binding protein 5/6)
MASLTKIMTALMVIEHGRLNDIATISRDAAGETGTRLGVIEGERWRVIDLLASSLIMSSNDTCRAMAEHVAGSQPLFVQMMNRRAGQLGLKNTRFRNACGHDEKGHYSSARDLAALVNSALQNRVFADAVGLAGGTVATSDGVRTLTITSTNELLGRYPGAAGVKTGYTPRAGKCLIALARRSEGSVLLILLNAPDRWWKAEEILNAAFDTLKKPAPDAPQDKFQ